MRIQIFSDLHADVAAPRPITVAPDIDAVVVAGDVCQGAERGFGLLRRIVPMPVPIIAVLGNHEHYRRCLPDELAESRRVAPLYGVHLLENATVVVSGVRFIGATLWTDYALFGEANVGRAMNVARDGLNDHLRIAWAKRPAWRRFRPDEALLLHRQSRTYIKTALKATSVVGPTVVVTHHAPHPGSLHPRYGNDLLSAAYVSDLGDIISTDGPDLWVHGHVHCTFDYRVGHTRVLCNAHGYGAENPAFDAGLVVEVAS